MSHSGIFHRLFILLSLSATLWGTSLGAATRSDITIILSADLKSYLYKERINCDAAVCLYRTPFLQQPLWIADENGHPLVLTDDGYKLENTSLSLMYKSKVEKVIQSSTQTQLSFSLSHLSELGDISAIQQRTIWALPDTAQISRYDITATNTDWQQFDSILKLESVSESNLQATIVVEARLDQQQSHSAPSLNTVSEPVEDEASTPCASAIELISKTTCDSSQAFVLEGLSFGQNSASLSPAARALLDQLIQPLIDSESRFEISAYTDSKGPKRWNLTISKKRAQTIRHYLIFKGINANKLVSKGYGESDPVATNDNTKGRSRNRRIEIRRLLQD